MSGRKNLDDIAKFHSDKSVVPRGEKPQSDKERADEFRQMWKAQRNSLGVGQKNDIAFSYLKHVVADEETAKKFVRGDMDADYEVGMVHSGSRKGKEDYISFWQDVSDIAGGYSSDDVKWLSSLGGYYGVSEMMFTIEPASIETSPIMCAIRTNMHAYK